VVFRVVVPAVGASRRRLHWNHVRVAIRHRFRVEVRFDDGNNLVSCLVQHVVHDDIEAALVASETHLVVVGRF